MLGESRASRAPGFDCILKIIILGVMFSRRSKISSRLFDRKFERVCCIVDCYYLKKTNVVNCFHTKTKKLEKNEYF